MESSDPNYHARGYNDIPDGMLKKTMILDSTLREGEQAPGVSFTKRQRLQVAWMLDYFGVDSIEISPIISPDHEEACKLMMKAGLTAKILAHVRALKSDIDVALRCGAEWIATYQSVSDIHLKYKLRMSREEALSRIVDVVEYSKAHGLHLRVTMEDATRADPRYLIAACRAAAKAKVDRIGLPDTVGVMRPRGMFKLVKAVREEVNLPIDVHCHNDLGLALANSLAGFEAGASQIHTTIDGLGERVGVTSLAEVVVALTTIYGVQLDVKLEMLRELSDLVASYTGIETPATKPLVGENSYKHKAGTHIAAIIRNSAAYEAIPPKAVGNVRKLIFGELSGKNSAAFLLHTLGLNPSVEDAVKFAQGLKRLRCGDLFELDLSEDMEREVVTVEEKIGSPWD